jgi:signal transduction histidine kinase
VFRLVQEALTNVQRHSGSRTASVRVRHSRGEIKVEIEDEGIGIAASRISNLSPGIGISGMRERIRQLHGSFNVKSGPSGTTVSAIIPCG